MSTKANYTPEEWKMLEDLPTYAGTTVIILAQSGWIGIAKEFGTLVMALVRIAEKYPNNELIQALFDNDGKRKEKGEKEANELKGKFDKPEDVTNWLVEQCRLASDLLARKSTPQESREYKELVVHLTKEAANASKEGGFLGMGGVQVSETEQQIINKVASALGVPA
jgi:hypothetical protein